MPFVSRITGREVSLFFQRLSVLMSAAVPIHEALFFLEKGEPNIAFRRVLDDVHLQVTRGHSLSRSLSAHRQVFGRLSIELLAVSESSGTLNVALDRVSSMLEQGRERENRVRGALAYPCCLAVVMLAVTYVFLAFVSPGDSGLFGALGNNIPWPTQVLIKASNFLTSPFWLCLASLALVGSFLWFRRIYHTRKEVRLVLHEALLRTPVLGSLLMRIELARTFDILASSVRVGASVVIGLVSAIRVAGNERYKHDLEGVLQSVKDGMHLGAAFDQVSFTPRYTTALLGVADESGNLDQVLSNLAQALELDVSEQLDQFVKLAEPVLLCLSGLVGGFVTIATLLPVIRLIATF
jgi:type II secretory pathway component PulF